VAAGGEVARLAALPGGAKPWALKCGGATTDVMIMSVDPIIIIFTAMMFIELWR
jgi:hypothetical protein